MPTKVKRHLSPEARQAISDAQTRRWARHRKQHGQKTGRRIVKAHREGRPLKLTSSADDLSDVLPTTPITSIQIVTLRWD